MNEEESGKATVFHKRDYNKFDQERFRILLNDKLKDNINCSKDVNTFANSVINNILETVDEPAVSEITPKIKSSVC